MRKAFWAHDRVRRLLLILLVLLTYFFLLGLDALRFFPTTYHAHTSPMTSWEPWVLYGFSAFVSLTFLAVGSLVWLYARNRRVAFFLFFFSFSMMILFAGQTGSAAKDHVISIITSPAAILALLSFPILLLLFPKDYLSSTRSEPTDTGSDKAREDNRRHFYSLIRWAYLTLLILLSIPSLTFDLLYYVLPANKFDVLSGIKNIYAIVALIGIIVIILVTYRQSSSLRERQQLRLFVGGVILASAPVLFLSIIPSSLNFSAKYYVNPQFSAITLGLFPLVLGYTILRYQVLIFDRYIRRAVAWMVGLVCLAILSYIVVLCNNILLGTNTSTVFILSVVAMAVLAPFVWWLAQLVTDHLFFSEILHYRRVIDSPNMIASESFDLNEAARLLTFAATTAFETQEVCLFMLDEDTGYYRIYPPLKADDPTQAPRELLAQQIHQASSQSVHAAKDWIEAGELLIQRLASAKHPISLSEASGSSDALPTGLARYLISSQAASAEPLLVSIIVQGKLLGFLALGARGDHQQYAGPDFEVIHLILSRFSSVLETARLYADKNRHVEILNSLYSANARPVEEFETVKDVAVMYASAASEAVNAGAEIWLYEAREQCLQMVTHEGPRPLLMSQNSLTLAASDWASWFFQGEIANPWQGPSAVVPSCLPQTPCFPFAWIPLMRGQRQLGMLVLTYPRPHVFSHEEKRVLEMFANQCAVTLDNARITIELRAAYERQKELDRLKDQFIVTASHELRTPLTAVLGYIELLSEYNESLTTEDRANFIAKARRGCDELTLMVGNIMDASRVHVDVDNVQLIQVSLVESITHVLEILEAMSRREHRVMQMDIPEGLCVMADDVRLRQVLLNLVSNALKYSPLGSSISVSAFRKEEEVTILVRDFGLGIPAEDQDRLFERFVRLVRDINSPTRGAGLGLYISKQLIEAMGGRIWVESSGIPGEGSTFAFTLQAALADAAVKEVTLTHQEV